MDKEEPLPTTYPAKIHQTDFDGFLQILDGFRQISIDFNRIYFVCRVGVCACVCAYSWGGDKQQKFGRWGGGCTPITPHRGKPWGYKENPEFVSSY